MNRLNIFHKVSVIGTLTFLLIALLGSGLSIGNEDEQNAEQATLEMGNKLYQQYCTPCHGEKGVGNGFNAARLLVKPANHTDAEFMSQRDDYKLFDVINMGGTGIAKSSLMPPWGATLGDVKLQSLILKLRNLCNCTAKEEGDW